MQILFATENCIRTGLVWYKWNDLRVMDHEPLYRAHEECSVVNHVMCIEPDWFSTKSKFYMILLNSSG